MMTSNMKPKLSFLTLSMLLGLTGTPLQAAETVDIEFHGYFRSGVLFSVEDDFKRANFPGQKETLGRLGLEADNDYMANLVSNWNFEDGRNFRINFGVGSKDAESGYSSSADGFDAGIVNAFIELQGVTPTGTFWAGKREYGRENYIFMTDFFYTDMSGIGVGVQGLGLGGYEFDFAYIASDRYDKDYDRWNDSLPQIGANETNLNNLLHAIQVGTSFGDLAVSVLLKAMPDNWDRRGYEWAETGFDITLTYKMDDSFFGLSQNGFSNIILQSGKGLGSGNLLGGTITEYNGFKPGSLHQGQHDDWGLAGDADYLLTQVAEDDTSTRMILWGGYTFDNGISVFPALQGQYNNMAVDADICLAGPIANEGRSRCTGDYNYWLSGMARVTVPVSQHFYMQGEVGHVHNNWGGSTWNQSKLTVAPTFILPTAYGVNPEIRLLATYLPKSWTNKDAAGEPQDDVILGFQADVWW